MKTYSHETIIITRKAWAFLMGCDRARRGFGPITPEWQERLWNKSFRNEGANPVTHPIAADEIRIHEDSYSIPFETVKELLTDNGFKYRQDGYTVEGAYI